MTKATRRITPPDAPVERATTADDVAIEASKIAAARQAVAEGRFISGEGAAAWLRTWAANEPLPDFPDQNRQD